MESILARPALGRICASEAAARTATLSSLAAVASAARAASSSTGPRAVAAAARASALSLGFSSILTSSGTQAVSLDVARACAAVSWSAAFAPSRRALTSGQIATLSAARIAPAAPASAGFVTAVLRKAIASASPRPASWPAIFTVTHGSLPAPRSHSWASDVTDGSACAPLARAATMRATISSRRPAFMSLGIAISSGSSMCRIVTPEQRRSSRAKTQCRCRLSSSEREACGDVGNGTLSLSTSGMASSNPAKPEPFVMATETSWPAGEITTSASATRAASLSGFPTARFWPMSARKLSVQRLCTCAWILRRYSTSPGPPMMGGSASLSEGRGAAATRLAGKAERAATNNAADRRLMRLMSSALPAASLIPARLRGMPSP